MDEETLSQVADALIRARRILVYGCGSATVVAQLFVRLLRHVGLRGELVESGGVDSVIALHDVNEDDVAVGVSLWLSFRDLVKFLRLARRLGATTVAIAGSHASVVHKSADHVVMAPAQGLIHSFSVVAPVAVAEIIIAKVTSSRREMTTEVRQILRDLYLEEGLVATGGMLKKDSNK